MIFFLLQGLLTKLHVFHLSLDKFSTNLFTIPNLASQNFLRTLTENHPMSTASRKQHEVHVPLHVKCHLMKTGARKITTELDPVSRSSRSPSCVRRYFPLPSSFQDNFDQVTPCYFNINFDNASFYIYEFQMGHKNEICPVDELISLTHMNAHEHKMPVLVFPYLRIEPLRCLSY